MMRDAFVIFVFAAIMVWVLTGCKSEGCGFKATRHSCNMEML